MTRPITTAQDINFARSMERLLRDAIAEAKRNGASAETIQQLEEKRDQWAFYIDIETDV
jgi:hypothetical protein